MKKLYELTEVFFGLLKGSTDIETDELNTFKVETVTFLKSGRKEDAFTVFFCFSEIFKLFGKGYDNTQKLLETLSDHEYHSGVLLNKHRDHYSHSAYVFALGLAIYGGDRAFRNNFLHFYGLHDDENGAYAFLKYWGMVALFHDIGYPFQLVHEQLKTYAAQVWGKKNPTVPYVSFGNIDNFIAIEEETKKKLKTSLKMKKKVNTLNELLAYGVAYRLGYDEELLVPRLKTRVVEQPKFLDHAYFSAVVFAKQLLSNPDFDMNKETLDVLTAILLHNNLNKYEIPERRPIQVEEHPLAYLISLCDELQCWDRLAYGKASKEAPIAWDAQFDFTDDKVEALYYFDSSKVQMGDDEEDNKNYEEINKQLFAEKIKGTEYVRSKLEDDQRPYSGYIRSNVEIKARAKEVRKDRKSKLYASDDSFINLCDFAKAINESYNEEALAANMPEKVMPFEARTLHYRVDNINQAKSYAEKLELVNCFYSNKDLDYPLMPAFDDPKFRNSGSDKLEFLAREEHLRWVKAKLKDGWKYGPVTDRANNTHNLIAPWEELSDEDKKYDRKMILNMPVLLKRFDKAMRIYEFREGHRPVLEIAGIGHRFFREDPETIKEQVKNILRTYSEEYRVVVRTGYAYGADQLIAECANELGITTKAVLPRVSSDTHENYESFIRYVREDVMAARGNYTDADELKLRHLLAQTVVCKPVPADFQPNENVYRRVGRHIINKAHRIILIWDGEKSDTEGGTCDCLRYAEEIKGMRIGVDIHTIKVTR